VAAKAEKEKRAKDRAKVKVKAAPPAAGSSKLSKAAIRESLFSSFGLLRLISRHVSKVLEEAPLQGARTPSKSS
jgi:hypothetical protein